MLDTQSAMKQSQYTLYSTSKHSVRKTKEEQQSNPIRSKNPVPSSTPNQSHTSSPPSSIAASWQLLFFPRLLPQNTQILLNLHCFISVSLSILSSNTFHQTRREKSWVFHFHPLKQLSYMCNRSTPPHLLPPPLDPLMVVQSIYTSKHIYV